MGGVALDGVGRGGLGWAGLGWGETGVVGWGGEVEWGRVGRTKMLKGG